MPGPLPRRTAWSTPAELHLVFSRLFLSDGDRSLQRDGLSRIKVWIARGNCPHAVESTANLLELVLRDSLDAVTGAPSTSKDVVPSASELRLSYSMAMIRFVNSLVDPLQTTYYARSIASLAASINLPLSFVELRHQATHEDLPSLSVLRGAARQALDWLYSHYWLPLISPSSQSSALSLPPLPLETLRPLLAQYKSLLKTSLKDASLAPRLKNDLLKVYKDIERWIADNALGGKGGGVKEERARERALRGVVGALVDEEGGLVPVAKKKRPTPRSPTLSPDLTSLWSPLLARLDSTYSSSSAPAFSDLIVDRAVELLTAPAMVSEEGAEEALSNPAADDKSYALTLAAWVAQIVVTVESAEVEEQDEEDERMDDGEVDGGKRRGWDDATDAVLKSCLLAGTPNALLLLDTLLRSRASLSAFSSSPDALAEKVKPLVAVLREADSGFAQSVGAEEAELLVGKMEQRQREVAEKLNSAALPLPSSASFSSSAAAISPAPSASSTWPAPLPNWTARPIGALPGGRVESLDLPPFVVAA
ncbi:hypothetical protein JCM8547_007281 [Rhodosporidiobolus lusitaniae]